jgi:hypothetical protein
MVNNGVGNIIDIRKKFHSTHELITTSYHEAGHAIFGLLKLIKIDNVYVYENKKSKRIEGYTHYSLPAPNSFNDISINNYWTISHICCKYAGLTSEKCFFKKISGSDHLPMFLRDGSSSDTLSANIMIRKSKLVLPGKDTLKFKKKLINITYKDLYDNWDAVTLLSHFLYKKKNIKYKELRSLLIKKSNRKKFWKKIFNNISTIYDTSKKEDISEIKLKELLAI